MSEYIQKLDANQRLALTQKIKRLVYDMSEELYEIILNSELNDKFVSGEKLKVLLKSFSMYFYQEILRKKLYDDDLFAVMYSAILSSSNNEIQGEQLFKMHTIYTLGCADEFMQDSAKFGLFHDRKKTFTRLFFQLIIENNEYYFNNFVYESDNTVKNSSCYRDVYLLLSRQNTVYTIADITDVTR